MVHYRLVPELSTVRVHATSNVHPIDGEASGLAGNVTFTLVGGEPDLAQPVAAEVTLAVHDLRSGNPAYDAEMRRRLQARRHPLITGRLTAAERLDADGRFRVTGDLSFHGATRQVTADIALDLAGTGRLVASWEQTIDIRDFDLKPPRILLFRVDPEVRVEVDLVADLAVPGPQPAGESPP